MMARVHSARIPSSLPTSMGRTLALRRGRAQWLTVVLGAVALLLLPRILSPFWIHLANGCLLAVIGATALNILTGNARLVSLGQAAFLGIGAFAAGLLQRAYNVPFPVALAAAAVAGALVGAAIALLSLRLRVLYVAVTTLVLHFAVTTVFSFVQAVFLDSTGIILPLPSLGLLELQTPTQWYYFLLAITTLIVLGALNLLRSFIGRRWIAVGEHDLAAEALGVIVGGVGSVLGSILGAVFITLLPYVLDQMFLLFDFRIRANVLAGIHQITFGGLIVAFLLFEPRGLAEIWRRVRSVVADWPFRYRSASRSAR
jgi:branched-chain amino acid transport system permease protein